MRRLASAIGVLLSAATAGCSGADAVPADEGGPLTALPACEAPPSPEVSEAVPGIELPDGAVVQSVERGDPLVTVQGYVPTTPVEVRRYYQQTDLEILLIEDEILEAEALVSNGTHRTYVKARAVCAEGSSLLAVVAPELDAQGLPVPTGG